MGYTDYTKATGGAGTMMIRVWNEGQSGVAYTNQVDFYLHTSSTATNSSGLPYRLFFNGAWYPNPNYTYGSFPWATGGGWRSLGSAIVSTSQTVYFDLGATGTSGFGGPTSFSIAIARATVPDAPTMLAPDEFTPNGMRVRFSGNGNGGAGITGWTLQRARDAAFTVGVSSVASSGTTTYIDMQHGETWHFRAYGSNSVGNSAWSGTGSGTTQDYPGKPNPPTLNSVTSTSASITITEASNGGAAIIGREIQYALNPAFTGAVLAPNPPALTFTLDSLTRNTDYWLRHRVNNAVGWGPQSDALQFKTALELPSAPTGYTASDITSTTAYSTSPGVADNGGGQLVNLRVEHNATAVSAGSTVVTVGRYSNAFMTGLPTGATRYFRMAVANTLGFGPYGDWVPFTTKNNVPNPPTSLAASLLANTTARLAWVAPSALNGSTIISYSLRVATNADFSAGLQSFSVPAGTLLKDLDGLQPGTTYHSQVWANTANGPGSYSTVISFVTTGVAPNPTSWWQRVAGSWKPGVLWHRVGGVWKVVTPWQRVSGVWKKL